MLLFIPLHFLCTHFSQLIYCVELLPMPTTDTTWPSYSILCYLLPFPTNHNLDFIHIYSHASILHVILPLICSLSYHNHASIQQLKFFYRLGALPVAQPTWKHWSYWYWYRNFLNWLMEAELCQEPAWTSQLFQQNVDQWQTDTMIEWLSSDFTFHST